MDYGKAKEKAKGKEESEGSKRPEFFACLEECKVKVARGRKETPFGKLRSTNEEHKFCMCKFHRVTHPLFPSPKCIGIPIDLKK